MVVVVNLWIDFFFDCKHLTLRFSDVFTTQHGDIEVNEAGKPKVVFIYFVLIIKLNVTAIVKILIKKVAKIFRSNICSKLTE